MGAPERGQVVPLLAVVLVLAVAAALVVVEVAVAAVERGRAQTAADAAALAGAAAGPDAAAHLAASNHAELLDFEEAGGRVRVRVRHRRATATAAAASGTVGGEPGAPGPALAAALARAGQVLDEPVVVVWASPSGVEVDAATGEQLAGLWATTGLCPRSSEADPVHFEACRPTPP